MPAAVRELERSGEVRIAAWFGGTDCCAHCTHEIRDLFRQNVPPPRDAGIVRSAEYARVTRVLRERMALALEMTSRTEQSRYAVPVETVDLLHMQAAWFLDLLLRERVTLVVFGNLPHFGADYVLYVAAKELGVRTVLTYETIEPNRFYVLYDLEDFGEFTAAGAAASAAGSTADDPAASGCESLASGRESAADDSAPESSYRVTWGFEKPLFVMPRRRKWKVPAASLAGRLFRRLIGHRRAMPVYEIFKRFEEERQFARSLRRHARHALDFGRPFVYFPLHLQPELTTSLLGGPYADQLLAVERLRELLPDDWWIYVKENPKQTARQRDAEFFARLSRIPNTLLAAGSVSTYELLEHCRFVATITGSAGWEAISGGKPALTFGRTWYQSLPGIVRYRPGLTLNDVLSAPITHGELERAYNRLLARAREGVIDPDYSAIVTDFCERENASRIAAFLRAELSKLPGASAGAGREAA